MTTPARTDLLRILSTDRCDPFPLPPIIRIYNICIYVILCQKKATSSAATRPSVAFSLARFSFSRTSSTVALSFDTDLCEDEPLDLPSGFLQGILELPPLGGERHAHDPTVPARPRCGARTPGKQGSPPCASWCCWQGPASGSARSCSRGIAGERQQRFSLRGRHAVPAQELLVDVLETAQESPQLPSAWHPPWNPSVPVPPFSSLSHMIFV